jgi:hypothetical protein
MPSRCEISATLSAFFEAAQVGPNFADLLSRNDTTEVCPLFFYADDSKPSHVASKRPGVRRETESVCGNGGRATAVSERIKRVVQLERDQSADEGRIYAALRRAEAEIASLEQRDLAPEVLRTALAAIRDKAVLMIQDVRKNMHNRILAARKLQETVGPAFLVQHTRFASDHAEEAALRTRFFKLLQRTPTSALLGYLKDALESGNFACAESIRFEFTCRDDRDLYSSEFEAIRRKYRDADPVEMQIRLITIASIAANVDKRVSDLLQRGR